MTDGVIVIAAVTDGVTVIEPVIVDVPVDLVVTEADPVMDGVIGDVPVCVTEGVGLLGVIEGLVVKDAVTVAVTV